MKIKKAKCLFINQLIFYVCKHVTVIKKKIKQLSNI